MGCTTSRIKQEENLTRTDLLQVNGHNTLLLGCSDSGKSTIRKQVKIGYQKGYSLSERLEFRSTIYRNFLESAEAVALAMRNLESGKDTQFRKSVETILACSTRMRTEGWLNVEASVDETAATRAAWRSHPERLLREVALEIGPLMRDPTFQDIIKKQRIGGIKIMESDVYFLKHVGRIVISPKYVPTIEDVLRAREKTFDVAESRFHVKGVPARILDPGGQPSEWKKWIHFLEGVNSILFCVAISEYDQTVPENTTKNRLQETLELFDSITHSQFFQRLSIVILCTKLDIFRQKIPNIPLSKYFQEYQGGPDVDIAAKFILWKFAVKANGRKTHAFIADALDTRNVKLVVEKVLFS